MLLPAITSGQQTVYAQHKAEQNLKRFSTNDTIAILSAIDKGMSFSGKHSDSSLVYFNQALKLSYMANYKNGIIKSLINIGYAEGNKGNTETSLRVFNNALLHSQSYKDSMSIYNGLGSVYNMEGKFDKAADYFMNTIRVAERHDKKTLPQLWLTYGYTLHLSGNHEKALVYADKALQQLAPEKIWLRSRLLNLKGVCLFYGANKTKEALILLDSAVAITLENNLQHEAHAPLVNKGTILIESGKPHDAIAPFRQAIDLSGKHNINLRDRMATLNALGDAYLQLDNFTEAERCFNQTWELAQHIPLEKIFLLEKLSELNAQKGDYKKAYTYHLACVDMKDSMTNKDIAAKINELETQYRTAEKDREIAGSKLTISEQNRQLAQKNFWISGSAGVGLVIALLALWRQSYLKHRYTIMTLQARMNGEEEERRRIAQELHDGINSQLVGIRGSLGTLGNHFPEVRSSAQYETASQILEYAAADLRNTVQNLWPLSITQKGLRAAIEDYCAQTARHSGLHVECSIYGDPDAREEQLSLNMFRIVQELLQNVVKHAGATSVTVLINITREKAEIIVDDNGRGFDPGDARAGSGLPSIRKRLTVHAGSINIEKSVPSGTTVSVTLKRSF